MASELIGTFCLVLFGCGAMVVETMTGSITHLGVGMVWGTIVMIMIYAIGSISGAHMNPAVTLAFTSLGRLPLRDAIGYSLAQTAGALLAAAALLIAMGDNAGDLGMTKLHPDITPIVGFAIEALMTTVLMFVVINVSTGAKEETIVAALAVGAVIAIEAIVAGPLTRASMNPARSIGPAVMHGDLTHLFAIYVPAPIVGAMCGGWLAKWGRQSQ